MKAIKFKCADCGSIFERSWIEEEVIAKKKEYGWEEIDADGVVCDMVCRGCYDDMLRYINC
jgi:hypothetical protein